MKFAVLVFGLAFTTVHISAQLSPRHSEILKVEWRKEFNILGSNSEAISGILMEGGHHLCVVSKQGVSKFFRFGDKTEPSEFLSEASYIWWIESNGQSFFSREANCVNERDFNSGAVLRNDCYQMPPNWATTSPVSKVYKDAFYYAGNYFLCKFSRDGEVLFKKEVAESGNSNFIRAGGPYIYLYGRYNALNNSRLIQYDTVGNLKWSISPSGFVSNILTDSHGNCYAFLVIPQKSNVVNKYDTEGNVIWSQTVPGQAIVNGSLYGDTLFVCGMESIEAANGQLQNPAYSAISAVNGEVFWQQTFNFYDGEEGSNEHFTHVVYDGNALYLGGTTGGQTKKCFLVKLSEEGNTTGLNDDKNPRTGFNIFPNPGGSKFSITSENNKTKTLKVTVRNLAGQVVLNKDISCNADGGYTLDLGKHSAGNYTVEIANGNDVSVKKIVVE